MSLTLEQDSATFKDCTCIFKSVSYQKKDLRRPTGPSFSWCDNNKVLCQVLGHAEFGYHEADTLKAGSYEGPPMNVVNI